MNEYIIYLKVYKRRVSVFTSLNFTKFFHFHLYMLNIKLNVQSIVAMCKMYLPECSKELLKAKWSQKIQIAF